MRYALWRLSCSSGSRPRHWSIRRYLSASVSPWTSPLADAYTDESARLTTQRLTMMTGATATQSILIAHADNAHTLSAALYVPGFADAFIAAHLSAAVTASAIGFFAIELPSYGRASVAANAAIGSVYDVDALHAHIDAAMREVRRRGYTLVTIIAHSYGGLIACEYAKRFIGAAHTDMPQLVSLILTAPLFEVRHALSPLMKRIVSALIRVAALIAPDAVVPAAVAHGVRYKKTDSAQTPLTQTRARPLSSGWYGRSLHADYNGEWKFDIAIKPLRRPPIRFGWIDGVMRMQRCIERGQCRLPIPILVLHSRTDGGGREWNESYTNSDAVLNAKDIRSRARQLAMHNVTNVTANAFTDDDVATFTQYHNITLCALDGALHDVFLSKKTTTQAAMRIAIRFITQTHARTSAA